MKIRPYFLLLTALVTKVRNWPVYFLNRYGFITTGDIRYRLRNGMTVISRPFAVDGSALNDVWLDESYDPNHFGIPFDWLSCRTIVDIGANIGTFSLFAAWKAPEARIVAVEPEPGNAATARKNIAANHLAPRISLTEAGIAAAPGKAALHVSEKNSGGHSLFKYTEKSHPVEVPLITLQSVFADHHINHCDFLKLDCEGGEYEGLYGLKEETIKGIHFIAVEYHHFSKDPRHTPETLKIFLEKHGFTVMQPKKSIFFAYRVSSG